MIVLNKDMKITKEQIMNPEQIEVKNIPGMGTAIVRWIVSGKNNYTIEVDSQKGGKVKWNKGS